MSKELFRTCPESGLQFHKPAEHLMKAHAVVGGGHTARWAVLPPCWLR